MFRLANISRRVLSATAPVAFKQTTRSTTILCVRKDGKVVRISMRLTLHISYVLMFIV